MHDGTSCKAAFARRGPVGFARKLAIKGSGKVNFGRIYSALLEVFYSYDGNVTRYARTEPGNPESPFEFQFGNFNQLGVNATLQARF